MPAPTFPSGNGQFRAAISWPASPSIAGRKSALGPAVASIWILTATTSTIPPTRTPPTATRPSTFGFANDKVFAGTFAYSFLPVGQAGDGFSKLAAYGDVNGVYRWLYANDYGQVVATITDPSAINGQPIAGDWNADPSGAQRVGLYTGTAWYFDTTGTGVVNPASVVTSLIPAGYPITGDFDGDGHVDLATYNDGVFSFQLWDAADSKYDIVRTISLVGMGVQLGANSRPVAADMDQDGITDIGVYTPDDTGALGTQTSEWYWLLSADPAKNTSGQALVQKRVTGQVNTLNHQFVDAPLGQDLFAEFGNTNALPVVGNFDPPAAPGSLPPVSSVVLESGRDQRRL